MTTGHIVVVPYDERWARDFEAIASEIRDALGQSNGPSVSAKVTSTAW